MRVISKARLVAFWQAQPAAERPLRAWYQDAAHAQWQSPQDNRQHCAGASFLAGNRVVFDIKGDHYRLVVAVAYRQGALFIKFVGTHAQYDAINATIGARTISDDPFALQPIRTPADHEAALAKAEHYFDAPEEPDPDSAEGAHFDALVTLIEAYERKRFSMARPSPIEAIKFRIEQQGLTPKDLQPMIGGLNRVYEVLAGKRPLSMAMVRRLHQQLGIPAESLIGGVA